MQIMHTALKSLGKNVQLKQILNMLLSSFNKKAQGLLFNKSSYMYLSKVAYQSKLKYGIRITLVCIIEWNKL